MFPMSSSHFLIIVSWDCSWPNGLSMEILVGGLQLLITQIQMGTPMIDEDEYAKNIHSRKIMNACIISFIYYMCYPFDLIGIDLIF